MFYTVQELAAQVKAWEYYIAILFLLLFIGYWFMLAQESARRRLQPVGTGARHPPEPHHAAEGRAATVSPQPKPQPCWEVMGCPPEKRQGCPAYAMRPLPCWVARLMVTGETWEQCPHCPVFGQSVDRLMAAATHSQARPPGA